jgi:hypothetical protein
MCDSFKTLYIQASRAIVVEIMGSCQGHALLARNESTMIRIVAEIICSSQDYTAAGFDQVGYAWGNDKIIITIAVDAECIVADKNDLIRQAGMSDRVMLRK